MTHAPRQVLAHANGGRLVGTIAVSDEPKPEAAQTVSTLQRLGKEVRAPRGSSTLRVENTSLPNRYQLCSNSSRP